MAITIADHDDTIRELASTKTVNQIALEIGYSNASVHHYCKKNNIKPVNGQKGQLDDHLKEIEEMAKTMTVKEIASEMGVNKDIVYSFCGSRNIKPKPAASIRDKKEQIIELAKTKTVAEIAEKVGYTKIYTSTYLKKLGIKAVGVDRLVDMDKTWWKPIDIEITENTLIHEYHQWWCFTYKKSTVREATFIKYRIANEYLQNKLPETKLKDVTRSVYQNFMNQLGETLTKQTVMDMNNLIKRSLRDAKYEGLIEKDPTYGLKLSGQEPNHTHQKFISQHEVDLLLKSLDYGTDLGNKATKYSWFIFLGVKTGFRMAEILGLTVDNFDFSENKITVDKTLKYKKSATEFQPTKNKSSMRTITVDNITMMLFKNLIKDAPEGIPIFAQDKKRIHNSSVNYYLRDKCEEAEIPKITSHSLRHTHASVLLANGVSMQTVSKRLGHSDLTTTQNVYSHITDELAEKDSEKVNNALSNLGGF